MGKFYKAPPNNPYKVDGQIVKIHVSIPIGTFEMLKKISEKMEMPISQLAAIAIDNELDASPSFNYPCPMPTTTFVEGAYAGEAQRIYDYLVKEGNGYDIETLVLSRRDMAIPSRTVFMLALRELLESGLVEAFKPTRTTFRYPINYSRLRAVRRDPRVLKKPNRYRAKINEVE